MKAFYGDDTITPLQQQHLSKRAAEEQEGKTIKNKYAVVLLFGSVILLIAGFSGYNSLQEGDTKGGIIWFVAGGLFLCVIAFGFIQTSLKERTAQIMHAKAMASKESMLKMVAEVPSKKALDVPPFKLEVYEQNELPDVSFAYNKDLTEDQNVFGITPLKIFYFFNFYSPGSWEKKIAGGWQRHGPVFHLGSPDDIAFTKTWKFYEIEKIVTSVLITSPEKLVEASDNSTYQPLPPRTKGLMGESAISGAYPVNSFLCTDTVWQQCVRLLFRKTDFSIIDAGDYTAERAGLQWEITQVINHLSTEKFLVLINGKTDLVSLAETFRKAWKDMDEVSPNNHKDVTAIRFIFYQVPDKVMAKRERKNFLLEILRQQTLSNDRIISFALQSTK